MSPTFPPERRNNFRKVWGPLIEGLVTYKSYVIFTSDFHKSCRSYVIFVSDDQEIVKSFTEGSEGL